MARLLPVLLIVAVLLAATLGLRGGLSWAWLGAHQAALRAVVRAAPLAAGLSFASVYALCAAISFPALALLSITGGWLFGPTVGTILSVSGASLGCILGFLIARFSVRPLLGQRAEATLARFRPGLQRDGFSYVLALRLIPVMPFWLITLAAALSGVRLWPFVAATGLGIIPINIVYTAIGAGLGGVLAAGAQPDLSRLLSAPLLLPLLGLALLPLLPVIWRRKRALPRPP